MNHGKSKARSIMVRIKDHEFEKAFDLFCLQEERFASSAILYLAKLGLIAYAKNGMHLEWESPPSKRERDQHRPRSVEHPD